MTILVLFILGTAWAVALVPPWLRRRREGHVADSILSFHDQLSTIQRATPAGRAAARRARPRAMSRSAACRRRRDVLVTLAAAMNLTLVMAVLLQGVAIVAFLVVAATLGLYTFMLVMARKRSVGRGAKVRYLAPRQAPSEPAQLLRRSASG